ncbi:MAG: GlsB/YeaQ/YmgE family stress response membrane protein [Candidatus Aminicenantales bacterium]
MMVIIGVVLAAAAYYFSPGRIKGGLLLTLLVGAVAALASTWLAWQVRVSMPGEPTGFFVAAIGTAVILVLWRTLMGREA